MDQLVPELAGQRILQPSANGLLEVQVAPGVALGDTRVLKLEQVLRLQGTQSLKDIVGGTQLTEGDRHQVIHLGLAE